MPYLLHRDTEINDMNTLLFPTTLITIIKKSASLQCCTTIGKLSSQHPKELQHNLEAAKPMQVSVWKQKSRVPLSHMHTSNVPCFLISVSLNAVGSLCNMGIRRVPSFALLSLLLLHDSAVLFDVGDDDTMHERISPKGTRLHIPL